MPKAEDQLFQTARPMKKDRLSPSALPGKTMMRESQFTRHRKRTRLVQEPFVNARMTLHRWFAGIDWADTKHDILILAETGRRLGTHQVAHTMVGLIELREILTAMCGPDRKADMACIVETQHDFLIAALLEAGFSVYPVNSKTVDQRRSASGAEAKRIVAYLLAK
jgi:hypothetical protein